MIHCNIVTVSTVLQCYSATLLRCYVVTFQIVNAVTIRWIVLLFFSSLKSVGLVAGGMPISLLNVRYVFIFISRTAWTISHIGSIWNVTKR